MIKSARILLILISKTFVFRNITLGMIHIWQSWKLPNIQDHHPTCTATSNILPTLWPWTSNFKQTLPLFQMITDQLKGNIILGWLLYVIRSFFLVSFCFQYRLINFVWLSIQLFSFSWSQSHLQNNFKKYKSSFSSSSYSEKMHWGQAEAFFVALHSCVCSGPKYHQMFS